MSSDANSKPSAYGGWPSKTEFVIDYIMHIISERNLKPGDPLPSESKIASEVGISRSTVREAVRSMRALGIIEAKQGAGLFVGDLSLAALRRILVFGARHDLKLLLDLYQIRTWLEATAIELATNQLRDEELSEVELCLYRWRLALERNESLSSHDRRFHRLLYECLGNQLLMRLLEAFWDVFEEFAIEDVRRDPAPEVSYHDHVRLFEAVRQRDASRAKDILLETHAGLRRRLSQMVENKKGGV